MNHTELTSIIIALVSFIATSLSISTYFINRTRNTKRDVVDDETNKSEVKIKLTEIQSDNQYIKRRVDDISLDQKDINKRLDQLGERLTRVEESSKQAHKRIDTIYKNKGDNSNE